MTFLKTILIILLVYYLLKILVKWFGPKLLAMQQRRPKNDFVRISGDLIINSIRTRKKWGM